MVQTKTTEWTIVILGRWNRAIFNPKWLTEKIFCADHVLVEAPMESWLPMKIKGDQILVIPDEDRLIVGLTEVNTKQLIKMEKITVRLLDLLSHTPIARTGINFTFTDTVTKRWMTTHFPNPLAANISEAGLIPRGRSYKLSFKHNKDGNLNVFCSFSDKNIHVKFNFDFETPTTDVAKQNIEGKLVEYRDEAISLLLKLFDLEVDEE